MMIELRVIESVDELMEWRSEVIANVFGKKPDEALLEANRRYYEKHLPDGSHVAVVASRDGTDCGCGAVCFSEELPSPDNSNGHCAYLMNIYVRPAYRNIGAAHSIVRYLIEIARQRNCGKIYLETTAIGRPVYYSLGFRDMPDILKLWN